MPPFPAETRPWEEQRDADEAAYRAQVAYLLERSAFYRERLAAAGFDSPAAVGGLADIARLPLTEKRDIRETFTAENPYGAHLCVAESEMLRIYSTSGTTGTPSFVPLTAQDVESWLVVS